MERKGTSTFSAAFFLLGACALTARSETVFFDYSDIVIQFDHTTSTLTISDGSATSLKGTVLDDGSTVIDRADISDASLFDLMLSATVSNPGGVDNVGINGTVGGTDTDVASPNAWNAGFANSMFGPDADGVVFSGGSLTIYGALTGLGGSILTHPVSGDWLFAGTSDAPDGPGVDGVANQITIPESLRASFTSGTAFFLDINIPTFGDGTGTGIAGDADEFFTQAAAHQGFTSAGGDFKVTITPEPATAFLVLLGAVFACRRRQLG